MERRRESKEDEKRRWQERTGTEKQEEGDYFMWVLSKPRFGSIYAIANSAYYCPALHCNDHPNPWMF